jgi:hypothetical protein
VHVDKAERKKPYSKKPDSYQSIIKKNVKKTEAAESMDDIEITPEVESSKERKLLRQSKKHDVDFYERIKNLPVTMTLEEAIKTFPQLSSKSVLALQT